MVSVINFYGCGLTVDHNYRRDLYSAARLHRRTGLITIWCDTEYLACNEPLCRGGLSAVAETFQLTSKHSAFMQVHYKAWAHPAFIRSAPSLVGSGHPLLMTHKRGGVVQYYYFYVSLHTQFRMVTRSEERDGLLLGCVSDGLKVRAWVVGWHLIFTGEIRKPWASVDPTNPVRC